MNQREIKFRAWLKTKKVMCEVIGIEFVRTSLAPYMIDVKTPEGHTFNRGSADQFILIQYTGLKDKNGTEIYEGDILSNRFYGKPVVVAFKNGAFVSEDVSIHDEQKEVIGNIYENKELLE